MVARISWFSKIDYLIWNFLEDHDIVFSPKVLALNIDYDRQYVGRRLRAMVDAGLIRQHDRGVYELSDLGREFLAGDLSVEEVEALDPSHDSAN